MVLGQGREAFGQIRPCVVLSVPLIIEKIYRNRIKGDRVKKEPPIFESVDPHIEVSGDIAWVTSWFRAQADVQGTPLPELSRATEIWKRTDDGWKMVHGHWSFGGPVAGVPGTGHARPDGQQACDREERTGREG